MDYLLSCIKFNFGGYGFIKNYQEIDLVTVFPLWFLTILGNLFKILFLIGFHIKIWYFLNTCKNNLIREWRDRRAIISTKRFENTECPICMDVYKNPLSINCGHIFCYDCLLILLEVKESKVQCPMCRSKIKTIEKAWNNFPSNLDMIKLKEQLIKRNMQFDHKTTTQVLITCLLGLGLMFTQNYILQKIYMTNE